MITFPKTRVCSCCGKRKPLSVRYFYKQKPPRIPKRMPDYRWDCIKCHAKKCRKRLIKVTTKVERRTYIRTYMRDYKLILNITGYQARL
jgi:tRNA U55 pseudouridine synthase TruB